MTLFLARQPPRQAAPDGPPMDSATARRMTLSLARQPPRQAAPDGPPMDSAGARRMTLSLARQPPRQAAPDRPPVEGNWGTLHCHPARKSQGDGSHILIGGVDGARTRDPRRDRPVF